MSIDPICGMTVKEDEAAGVSVYEGKTYYFCSTGCKKTFDENPEKYLREEKPVAVKPWHSDRATGIDTETETEAEVGETGERIDIPIVGMSCASCASWNRVRPMQLTDLF